MNFLASFSLVILLALFSFTSSLDAFIITSNLAMIKSTTPYSPYRESSSSLSATKKNQNQNQNSNSRNRSRHLTIQGTQVLAALTLPSLLFQTQIQTTNSRQNNKNQYIVNALDEPTQEFLELDKKKREFRARQMEIRKDWDVEMEKFLLMKDENQIIKQMETFTKIIRVAEGLPIGVSKKQMVSQMRRVKKAGKEQGYWTTEVEKAYQAYIRGVDYIQSPNTDRQI